MAPRTSPRTYDLFNLSHLLVRLAALGTAIAVLICLALDSHWYGKTDENGIRIFGKHTHGFAIATATVAIIIDVWECITTLDARRKLKRIPTGAIAGFDMIILCCTIVSVIADVLTSDVRPGQHLSGFSEPFAGIEATAEYLMAALIAETGVLVLLDSLNCCIYVGNRRRLQVDPNDTGLIMSTPLARVTRGTEAA